MSGYTPQSIDAQWQAQEGGPLQSPEKTITLSNGLLVPSLVVMPTAQWASAGEQNWPDAEGEWLNNFGPETSDYFKRQTPDHSASDY